MAEFDTCLPSEIATAALAALQGKASLVSYFTDENDVLQILDSEIETGFVGGGFTSPTLLVAIDEMEEVPQPSGVSELTTTLRITLITPLRNTPGTQGFLRARMVDEIKTALFGEEFGLLRNANGDRLTESVLTFGRVGEPLIVDNTLRTPMQAAWLSTILTGTRELAP